MTVAELDDRMTLTEFLAWQDFDGWWRATVEAARADEGAFAAGEPDEDMLEEAARDARARGLEVGDDMVGEALRDARARGLEV